MSIAARIHEVFGHFQNLNLLVLMQDLRAGQIARQSWSTGSSLCPIAHGLPAGRDVRRLVVMGQEADLRRGCAFAAGVLALMAKPFIASCVAGMSRVWTAPCCSVILKSCGKSAWRMPRRCKESLKRRRWSMMLQ
jgi:hypothetical protein